MQSLQHDNLDFMLTHRQRKATQRKIIVKIIIMVSIGYMFQIYVKTDVYVNMFTSEHRSKDV